MKVSLNIDNDEELRLYVKDLIRGQMLSIAREELREMTVAELNRIISSKSETVFMQIFRECMQKAITQLLITKHGVSEWNKDFIKPYVESRINECLNGRPTEALVLEIAKKLTGTK